MSSTTAAELALGQRLGRGNRDDAEPGALPQVLVLELGHGDVELPQPVLHRRSTIRLSLSDRAPAMCSSSESRATTMAECTSEAEVGEAWSDGSHALALGARRQLEP